MRSFFVTGNSIPRAITAFTIGTCLFACATVLGISRTKDSGVSKPPGRICWTIKEESNGQVYCIVPYEVVSYEGYKKCRELIGGDYDEPGKGFLFFIVIVDNHRGEKPVRFNAFGGDARFYYFPRTSGRSSRTSAPPSPRTFGFVNLRNYFADPSNMPEDKAGYREIQEMFETNLTVPAGSYGWSLACIRDSFVYDLRRNKVVWAIPGDFPQPMEVCANRPTAKSRTNRMNQHERNAFIA